MNQLKRTFLFGVMAVALAGLLGSYKLRATSYERGEESYELRATSYERVLPGAGTQLAAHGSQLEWMSIDEASGRLQKEQRPVLIDLYTNWCGWCKQMDRKTYSNKQVAQYLQEKFYPVKVDAETKAAIKWNGRTYQFNAHYRANEFAVYLAHGQLEFPTTIIIPPGGEPQAIPGYMEPKELEMLVKYFGEGKYKTQGFDEFQRSFKASW